MRHVVFRLKTALRRARDELVAKQGGLTRRDQADLAAAFQHAVRDILVEKSRRAIDRYLAMTPGAPAMAVAGGVAANTPIRAGIGDLCAASGLAFAAPPLALCTDNAAMIAYAGIERFRLGLTDDMHLKARPRWPLDESVAPQLGSGRKGAKA